MNSKEINVSNQYFKEIEQGNLVSMGRASSLGWILFVKDDEEYALHLQRPSGLQWMKRFFLQVLKCFSHPIESGRMINLILRPLNGTYREITDMMKE